ncbi:aldo/keto reductase [Aestuariivirga sp.]|uniref:aldo/keto reductase n=1 Tax=Aestuariivirga sp. TaxID=2650926 RepID=UPI0039197303
MKMNTLVQVGKSGVGVPRIGFGATALADMPDTYGYSVGEDRALATIRAILDQPNGFIDTSRNYGLGRSEDLIGRVVRERGGWPAGRILSTKLDRDMNTLRFDGAQARRSIEASLSALGVDSVDVLHLHDPEYASDLSDVTGRGGALDALMRMKEEGLARAVGLAAGRIDIMMPILRDWDFDALITHNRFTLVNRNAEPMLDLAASRGIAVFNAAPYASGALAKGAASQQRYVYQLATEEVLRPIRRVEEICARHGIPLGAAALQFSLRDRRIASTICGVSRPERVAETLQWADWPISQEAWEELLALPASRDDPEATREYSPG